MEHQKFPLPYLSVLQSSWMSWACLWTRVWHIMLSSNPSPSWDHAAHEDHGDSPRWRGNGQCLVLHGLDADNNTSKGGIDFQQFGNHMPVRSPSWLANKWAEASHTILCQGLYLLDRFDTLSINKPHIIIKKELDAPEHGFQFNINGLGCCHRLSHLGSRNFRIAVVCSRCFPSGVVAP